MTTRFLDGHLETDQKRNNHPDLDRENEKVQIPQESLLPQQTDKLRLIRAVSDRIQQNMLNAYNPSKDLTVDERMIPFRGHCAFKVYMKNKPCKYGIKM